MSEDDELSPAIERFAADPIGFHLSFVESGDKAALYALIERFIRTVKKGQEIDSRLLEFITGRLERILNGEDPRKVFPKPGREGAPPKTLEHFKLAAAVALHILGQKAPPGNFSDQPRHYQRIDGQYWFRRCTDEVAIAEVAQASGKTKSAVEAVFNDYRHAAYRQAVFVRERLKNRG